MDQAVTAIPAPTLRRLAPFLPGDLLGQLRACSDRQAPAGAKKTLVASLQQAINTLDSLHHTLTNFLPRYILDLSPTPGQHQGELLEGSFIFADVTGFTALTGELSRRGTEGREEMNRLMRALFAALLDPLLASGGDLLIFAGDAVLAYFPASPDSRDARWAARTALRLVEAIAPLAHLETPYGTFSLTMSAGVERGQAFAAIVGTERRMEFLISGGPVQGAMRAEGEGKPGEVIVGPSIMPLIRREEFLLRGNVVGGIRGEELADYEPAPPSRRRSRLAAILSRRIPDLIAHVEQALTQVESLVPFIPPDLFTQLARGEDVRQHPPVAVQFVNVLGLEDLALGPAGPAQAAAVLQRYFVQAQEIVADREGVISQVDPYSRGFTLLNPFGALTHHEKIPALAASAGLELAHVLDNVNREFSLDPPLVQRAGMTYDRIFTGEIGYRHRREYVVAGPAVNLAARLMSKADPGQIVLDPAVWEQVQQDFTADPLPPIPLKGIAEPVPRFDLKKLRQERGFHLADYPLVGRRDELEELEGRLQRAAAGEGGALAITGEAGIGKSRLLAALAESATSLGAAVLTGRCHPFTRTTPYLPWADLIGQWCRFDEGMPAADRHRLLRERLAELDLTSALPLLSDLLGLPATRLAPRPEEDGEQKGPGLFAALKRQAEQGQKEVRDLAALLIERTSEAKPSRTATTSRSIWEIVHQRASIPHGLQLFLAKLAARQPILVLIEDIQWMDADSLEVLKQVATATSGMALLLLVTARPETDWNGDRLPLSPLPDADSQALAALALRATSLQRELAHWLSDRAQGKPLFTLVYCNALRDSGAVVVDPVTGEARWSGPPPLLPLSLQELLLAQVDRLGQDVRDLLQRGAVIGTSFPIWLLGHLYQDAPSPDQLEEALYRAARRSLIVPPPPAQGYTFSSQSLHDAIYATLSHSLRQSWHERIGDLLAEERQTRYERLEQIAHHYSRCNDPHKAALFTRLAGDKARTRQADEAALTFYNQTLAVTDGAEEISVERRLAQEGIGDMQALRGAVADAYVSYRNSLADAPPEAARRLQAKLALLVPLTGQTEPTPLEEAYQALPPSSPLRDWLAAALVWVNAERGDTVIAAVLCQDLLPAGGPVRALLQEAVRSLEQGGTLPPYTDFFTLFTHSFLRSPQGDIT